MNKPQQLNKLTMHAIKDIFYDVLWIRDFPRVPCTWIPVLTKTKLELNLKLKLELKIFRYGKRSLLFSLQSALIFTLENGRQLKTQCICFCCETREKIIHTFINCLVNDFIWHLWIILYKRQQHSANCGWKLTVDNCYMHVNKLNRQNYKGLSKIYRSN